LDPRVAAQRGNPGLTYATASRYKSLPVRLDQSFLQFVAIWPKLAEIRKRLPSDTLQFVADEVETPWEDWISSEALLFIPTIIVPQRRQTKSVSDILLTDSFYLCCAV
jgi:hypothetical protein